MRSRTRFFSSPAPFVSLSASLPPGRSHIFACEPEWGALGDGVGGTT